MLLSAFVVWGCITKTREAVLLTKRYEYDIILPYLNEVLL